MTRFGALLALVAVIVAAVFVAWPRFVAWRVANDEAQAIKAVPSPAKRATSPNDPNAAPFKSIEIASDRTRPIASATGTNMPAPEPGTVDEAKREHCTGLRVAIDQAKADVAARTASLAEMPSATDEERAKRAEAQGVLDSNRRQLAEFESDLIDCP